MEKSQENDFDDYMDYLKRYPIFFADATQIEFKSDSETLKHMMEKYGDYYDSEHHEELRQRYNELLKEYTKYCLNSIYGSRQHSNCEIQDENERLKSENKNLLAELQKLKKKVETYAFDIEWSHDVKLQEALAKQRDDMEREYKETYAMFEKRCKKYAEELANAKADLAEANYLIKKLLHEQLQCRRPLRKGGTVDECQTEVQETKEENRATRESKDTD